MNDNDLENIGREISASKGASSFISEPIENFYLRLGEYRNQWNDIGDEEGVFKFKCVCTG